MGSQEQGRGSVCQSVRWNIGRLGGWCKRKRKTILICGAMILVVGLAARRHYVMNRSQTPFSFPTDEDVKPMDDTRIEISSAIASTSDTSIQSNAFITDKDRIALEHCLQSDESRPWEWHEILKQNRQTFDYILKSRKPKEGGPMQYLSTTTYKTITDTNQIKNFIMDNDYKKEWDDKFLSIEQLDLDSDTGIEVLHIIKKFPIIGKRDYVLASKLWKKKEDQTFFCVTKAWNNERAPKPTCIRVTNYLSGWRISKILNNGCEMKMFHQEDIKSMAADFMKDKIGGKIFEYVELTERHLQEYIRQKREPKKGSAANLAQEF